MGGLSIGNTVRFLASFGERVRKASVWQKDPHIVAPSADCVPILEMGYSGGKDVDGLRISYIVEGELVKG